jgi:hypothetical protein
VPLILFGNQSSGRSYPRINPKLARCASSVPYLNRPFDEVATIAPTRGEAGKQPREWRDVVRIVAGVMDIGP